MNADGTITWRQLLDETARVHDRVRARWLCEEASGAFGDEFRDVLDEPATERGVAHLDTMLHRVAAGEPLQYVLGHWAFRRLDLLVDQRVLIPRPETELVAERAIELIRRFGASPSTPCRCADLGAGSGAIGLSVLAELPRGAVEVWLTDRSPDALDVARANGAGLGMAGAGARYAVGSWFDALPSELAGTLHVVVSNPPYIATDDQRVDASVREWEPSSALYAGADGLDDLRQLASQAPQWLVDGGWLVLEIGTGQGASVATLLSDAGLVDVEVAADLAGHDRIASARLMKSS